MREVEMSKKIFLSFLIILVVQLTLEGQTRKRARECGIEIGILKPGKWNAITDVKGVKVGHKTIIEGTTIRTGVTVIMPHERNIYREKVPSGVFLGNAFGKSTGLAQIQEIGQIETPIALTSTLSVWNVANGILDYILSIPENADLITCNPVVGETNDGLINDGPGRHVKREHVLEAIKNAKSGPVEEGNVGAGTATLCLGFKGGIGTSSRVLPPESGGYTIGVLVQSNFGGILSINGAPVGRELGRFYKPRGMRDQSERDPGGSCMIIIATDAPLSAHNLMRLAKRSYLAFSRVGSPSHSYSGDFSIAFTTHPGTLITERAFAEDESVEYPTLNIKNPSLSPLFLAAVDATEEAILNSLFMAEDMSSSKFSMKALPIPETLEILKKYNSLNWNKRLDPYDKN